jgi:hypothetical protein
MRRAENCSTPSLATMFSSTCKRPPGPWSQFVGRVETGYLLDRLFAPRLAAPFFGSASLGIAVLWVGAPSLFAGAFLANSGELAKRTNTAERCVPEWLCNHRQTLSQRCNQTRLFLIAIGEKQAPSSKSRLSYDRSVATYCASRISPDSRRQSADYPVPTA